MRRMCLLTLLAAGCGPGDADDVGPVELTWMEGAGFGWEHFNHRVSHLEMRVHDAAASVAIIGGTSTTGLDTELDDQCDASTCGEVPVLDRSDVEVRWARATVPELSIARGTATLVVGAEGDTTDLVLDLPAPGAHTVAVIGGLVLDTDQPLAGGDACYQPRNGWVPRRIQVALGDPAVEGETVKVPVSASFEAGNTLEHMRECLDAVTDRARVHLEVQVLVASGDGPAASHTVEHQVAYSWNGNSISPEPQDPVAPEPLDLDPQALVAFSAIDFSFHIDDPELRGAYLRTWGFEVTDGGARGVATNYSPLTQLSAFDYAFSGTVRELQLGVAVERGVAVGYLETAIDADGRPVVYDLPLD